MNDIDRLAEAGLVRARPERTLAGAGQGPA